MRLRFKGGMITPQLARDRRDEPPRPSRSITPTPVPGVMSSPIRPRPGRDHRSGAGFRRQVRPRHACLRAETARLRARARTCRCAGCWKPTPTPIIFPPRNGSPRNCPMRWSRSVRGFAKSSAHSRRSSNLDDLATAARPFDRLFGDDDEFALGAMKAHRDSGAGPHARQPRLSDRRCTVHRRLAVHARCRHRALRFPRRRCGDAVPLDPPPVATAGYHPRVRLPRLRHQADGAAGRGPPAKPPSASRSAATSMSAMA